MKFARRLTPLFLTAALSLTMVAARAQDSDTLTIFQEGQAALGDQDYALAADKFQQCVDANDDFGAAWFMLGYARHMNKQLDEAIEAHKRAAEFDDSQFKPIAIYNLGCAYALTGRRDEALAELQRAVDEGYNDSNQFREDSDLNSLHTSTEFAAMLARMDGQDEIAEQLEKAQGLLEEQDFASAVEIYREVLEADGENDFACYRLGFSLHGAGNLDEAITYHKKATDFPATKGIALYNWGCALSLKGDVDAAMEKLVEAVDHGFIRPDAYQYDPDLNNLRDKPEFEELVAKVQTLAEKHMAMRPAVESEDSADAESANKKEKAAEENKDEDEQKDDKNKKAEDKDDQGDDDDDGDGNLAA
jgi:Flp pilus assembly protein TadD